MGPRELGTSGTAGSYVLRSAVATAWVLLANVMVPPKEGAGKVKTVGAAMKVIRIHLLPPLTFRLTMTWGEMSLEFSGLAMKTDGVVGDLLLNGGTMVSVEPSKDAVESLLDEISEMGLRGKAWPNHTRVEEISMHDTCTLVLTAERTADQAKVEIARWVGIDEVNSMSDTGEASISFIRIGIPMPTRWSCDLGWAVAEKSTPITVIWKSTDALPTFSAHLTCYRSQDTGYDTGRFLRAVDVLLDQAKLGKSLVATDDNAWYDDDSDDDSVHTNDIPDDDSDDDAA